MNNIKLSATGHRPPTIWDKDPYNIENFRKLVKFATEEISKIEEKYNVVEVISGGALGWDQAIGAAAIKLEIPLTMALPFPNMDSKWAEDSKKIFQWLLSKAEKINILEKEYSNAAYYTRDKWMVDNSNIMLALFNGVRAKRAVL